MTEPIPTQGELLLRIDLIRQQAYHWLIESDQQKNHGNLLATTAAYQQLIEILKQQLHLTLLYNRHYSSQRRIDIESIIRPLANTILTQADVEEALGNLQDADVLRNEALALSRQYLSPLATAETERQRASVLVSLGRFNEALVAMTNARDLFQAEGKISDLALITINLATILEWLGDFERAQVEAERASNLIRPLLLPQDSRSPNIAQTLVEGEWQQALELARLSQIASELNGVLARIYRFTDRLNDAECIFQKALLDASAQTRPAVETHLAAIAIQRGQYREGFVYSERLMPHFKGLLRPKLGVLLRLQAEALLGLDQVELALCAIDAAIHDVARYYDPDSLWKMQWLRGRILDRLNRLMEALEVYKEAAETINHLRKAPLGYRLDSTYLKDKLPVFTAAIELATKTGDAESCCQLMEMIKSRILTATLSIPRVSPSEATIPIEGQIDELASQINRIEYVAFRDGWTVERSQQHVTLLNERTALLERLRISDPRWHHLTEPIPFDLDRVQYELNRRGQASLNLFYQPDQVVAVLLKENRISVLAAAISVDTAAALEHYLNNLQMSTNTGKPERFDISQALGVTAEQLIPAALLRQAIEADSLVIIPHGPLHLVPWAGLTFQGRRLFEYCPVSILPNLSCLLNLLGDFSSHPKAALFGSPDYTGLKDLKPLYLATEELQTLQEIYSVRAGLVMHVVLGKEATQMNLRSLMAHSDAESSILHLACHGKFDPSEPMNSCLLLKDGKIDAAEIARDHLRYEEVVLSACSTGQRPTTVQGVMLTGDDILGLPGAFLEAGARSVLVSIPPAEDRAALSFMTLYHECRADGMTPLRAFQHTQKSLLAAATYPIHLWVGFTLYGCQ